MDIILLTVRIAFRYWSYEVIIFLSLWRYSGPRAPPCWGFKITRNYTHTHARARAVGLLWTSDRPVTKPPTGLLTLLTRDRHPWSRRNSNP